LFRSQKFFETLTLELKSGDSYYLASDGFQDQFGGEEDKKFLKKRFRELLLALSQQPIPTQAQVLETTFQDWKGQRIQTDDVLVIGIGF
ncbi:MAG TPA: serine/threonine protein kinase, partial [Microscillaceae bacterium]|nr:serine/threonine protein kinase [Microscillaceae bacterium]